MNDPDPHRSGVRAVRAVEQELWIGATPGLMVPVTARVGARQEHAGYILACPGCGLALSVTTNPRTTVRTDAASWQESGDLDAGTLTLTPSLWHQGPQNRATANGCGWHGWLQDGVFNSV